MSARPPTRTIAYPAQCRVQQAPGARGVDAQVGRRRVASRVVRRHHLVPQMVMKRFADDDGRLVMVGREPPHRVVKSAVKTAAAEAGFYRIETDDVAESHRAGHDPELVEDALAGVETVVAPLLDALIDGRFPSLEDRYRLSLFVALQWGRGWRLREDIDRVATLLMRNDLAATWTVPAVRERLAGLGLPSGPEDAAAFADQAFGEDGPTLRLDQAHMVQQTLRFAVESVLPLVYFRAWRVVRFDRPVLLTSDAPVASWSPASRHGLPVGIGNARETYMPLNRRTVLVVTGRSLDDRPDRLVETRRLARAARVNAVVAGGAHRWLFHHPDDSPMVRLALGPPERWQEEVTDVTPQEDGTARVRGMFVRRPTMPKG